MEAGANVAWLSCTIAPPSTPHSTPPLALATRGGLTEEEEQEGTEEEDFEEETGFTTTSFTRTSTTSITT